MNAAAPGRLVPRTAAFDLGPFDVPHPCPFVCDLAIEDRPRQGAIDHVSNVEYVRWLDRAAELHADHLGYTRQRLLDDGIMWFVARHEIDYVAEVWPGDGLIVATWVRDMRRIKSWRDYVVLRPRDDAVVCRAATLLVLVDLATRRPRRIPRPMAHRFAPLLRPAGTAAPT